MQVTQQTTNPDGSTKNPTFWTDYNIVYTWFRDWNTSRTSVLGPVTIFQWYWPSIGRYGTYNQNATKDPQGDVPPTSPKDTTGVVGTMSFAGKSTFSDPIEFVRFSGMAVGPDSVDCTELPGAPIGNWREQSMGGVAIAAPGAGQTCAYSYQINYDVDVLSFGNGSTNAQITDNFETPIQYKQDGVTQKQPQSTFLTCPVTRQYHIPSTGWETHWKVAPGNLFFDFYGGWGQHRHPPVESDDYHIAIFAQTALADPAGTGAVYYPLTVDLPPEVLIESTRQNPWVTNDPSKGTVDDNAPQGPSDPPLQPAVFHVAPITDPHAPLVQFSRQLKESWRSWTDPNGTPPFAGKPMPDNYETTQHPDGDDVWAWESYGWLVIKITSPAVDPNQDPPPPMPTLTVSGNYLEITDTHETSLDLRTAAFHRTLHPFGYIYQLPLDPGDNTLFIDLLFPVQSAGSFPSYVSRVDSLVLTGLLPGDTTLTEMTLTTRENGYFKIDYGPPVQRKDYSALHASQDGAFPFGTWPDLLYKKDEIGQPPLYGGALRYIDPITNSQTGDINDRQFSVSEIALRWALLEAWNPVYDHAPFLAANSDSYGTAFGYEPACWIRPNVPHTRYTPGTPWKPPCGPMVRSIFIVNGRPITAYSRWSIDGAIEALIADNNTRAGAGIPVDAISDDTAIPTVTANTDASGYVTLSPLPANGALNWFIQPEGGQASNGVALRPRDRVRLFGLLIIPGEVSLIRDNSWRTYLFHAETIGMKMETYSDEDDNPTVTDIEPGVKCASPDFSLTAARFEGVYVKVDDRAVRTAISADQGGTWQLDTLDGFYDVARFAHWHHQFVVAVFRKADKDDKVPPSNAQGTWFARVGLLPENPDPTLPLVIAWGPEQDMKLLNAVGIGDLKVLFREAMLEFAWRDTSGNINISRCYQMPDDGTGVWQ